MLQSDTFVAAHRVRPQDFSRQRTLTFPTMVACLAQGMTHSLQIELDDFFGRLADQAHFIRNASKSAFSQARRKLKASVFNDLNAFFLEHWQSHVSEPLWHGFRLVAGDVTSLRLPKTPEVIAEFGEVGDRWGGTAPMAQAFALQAVHSGLLVHAELHPAKARERSMLARSVEHLKADDLLILDRGFPAAWLFAWLHQHQRHFCCRIDSEANAWLPDFVASGEAERIIEITLSSQSVRKAEAAGFAISLPSLRYRAIRVDLPHGGVEVLATSLLDSAAYPAEEFAALYHQRWRIEECFKLLKCRLAIEHFSGESPEAVRQDFLAKVWLGNLTTSFAYFARAALPAPLNVRFKPNLTYAASALKAKLPSWMLKLAFDIKGFQDLIQLIARTLEWIRPGRSAPRPRQVVKLVRHRAYKPVR
jgi:hypothetical protein